MTMNCLILGASGGIGQALAKRLATRGTRLFLVHGPGTICTPPWVEQIRGTCDEVVWAGGELNDPDVMDAVVAQAEAVVSEWGPLEALVSCIGRAADRRPIAAWDSAYLHQAIVDNFTVPALAVGRCLSLLRSPGGVVALVGSIAGITGSGSGSGAYCCAKAALHNLLPTLTKELAPRGIRTVCLAPGLVDTSFHRQYREHAAFAAETATAARRIATATEMADTLALLLDDRLAYVWGTVVRSDGGLL
jgi:3-oxoacyl-[acyl-carrier protein] reductase